MNANGVAAALNFPSYPQFCGQYFARAQDKELGLAVLRAVDALRAQAKDVDLGFRSSERLKKTGTDTVSVLDLAAKLPT